MSKTDSEITFKIDDVSPAFANSLRRIMTTEVPVMAIEWVEFRKNDSAVPDELLANRLGQIPFTFDPKLYNLPDECKCEGKGCSRCQVKVIMKVKGPKMVYSSNLKTRNKDVKPVFDNIPIVELFEDEGIEFEATAQLGLGKTHAKWQAANVGYKNTPDIKIGVKNPKDFERYIKACPKNVFKIEKNKLVVVKPYECNLCMQCVDLGGVEVKAVKNSFIFYVESVCGLSPEVVITTSADVLEDKMGKFVKELKKLK